LERVGQEKSLGSPNVFIPGVRGPAGVAEIEPPDELGVRGEMGTITLITDVVSVVFHDPIVSKYIPTT